MVDSPVTVNQLSWRDLLPSLVIFRALPASLTLPVLALSLFAVAATPIGWIITESLLISETSDLASDGAFQAIAELNRSPWKAAYPRAAADESLLTILGHQLRGVELVFNTAVRSVGGIFSLETGIRRFLYFLGGGLWTVLIWAFFGCAITRTALMRFTREESIGIDDAFAYASEKFLSCVGGIAIPLLGIFGMAIPIAILGFIMTSNVGAAIGGLLWVVVLCMSLTMAFILLGLMFAWPLIISAISCEGQDSFDGMSRAFAYVFQRPLHYFVYALIAVVFSGVCWLIASALVGGTIQTAHWAASWGMNTLDGQRAEKLSDPAEINFGQTLLQADSADEVLAIAQNEARGGRDIATLRQDSDPDLISPDRAVRDGDNLDDDASANATSQPASLAFGKRMIRFWNNFARTLGAAFLYGLFWCLSAAIYLLLRKDLDATEMDEIYLSEDRRSYELPPLKDDSSGVPQVDDDAELPAQVEPPKPSNEDPQDES
ncbi:MAG: hypothetical protein GY819_11010 [Planctomycetaceae bacterium]|nr:hypothetical protein [Planctomycetaceae bacterium]